MPKAEKLVLLLTIFCLSLGVAPQLHAQEKLVGTTLGTVNQNHTCTTLESFLLTKIDNCIATHLSQKETAVKAALKNNQDEKPITFSYSLEEAYFVPPTPTPTETPKSDSVETEPLTVSPTPQTQVPQDFMAAEGINLDSNLILDLINEHRVSIGKPSFLKDDALCSLAQTRSVELHNELFVNGNLHSGLYNRNLPYWITENAKWGSNEAGTVQWWLDSPVHRSAIEGDHTFSCGACNGTQCSQLFTSYTPKG